MTKHYQAVYYSVYTNSECRIVKFIARNLREAKRMALLAVDTGETLQLVFECWAD